MAWMDHVRVDDVHHGYGCVHGVILHVHARVHGVRLNVAKPLSHQYGSHRKINCWLIFNNQN